MPKIMMTDSAMRSLERAGLVYSHTSLNSWHSYKNSEYAPGWYTLNTVHIASESHSRSYDGGGCHCSTRSCGPELDLNSDMLYELIAALAPTLPVPVYREMVAKHVQKQDSGSFDYYGNGDHNVILLVEVKPFLRDIRSYIDEEKWAEYMLH